jgi:hypothetical protein
MNSKISRKNGRQEKVNQSRIAIFCACLEDAHKPGGQNVVGGGVGTVRGTRSKAPLQTERPAGLLNQLQAP